MEDSRLIRLKLTGPAGHMLVGAKTDKYESRAPLQKGELIEADPPDDYTIRYDTEAAGWPWLVQSTTLLH